MVKPILLNSFLLFFIFVIILLAHSTFYFIGITYILFTLNLIFIAYLNSHEHTLSLLINADCIVSNFSIIPSASFALSCPGSLSFYSRGCINLKTSVQILLFHVSSKYIIIKNCWIVRWLPILNYYKQHCYKSLFIYNKFFLFWVIALGYISRNEITQSKAWLILCFCYLRGLLSIKQMAYFSYYKSNSCSL